MMIFVCASWSGLRRHGHGNSCGGCGHLINNQNMNAKSNKIEPYPDENGWDFGDYMERGQGGTLFEEELVEYHKETTECDLLAFLDNPLELFCMALFCPVFICFIAIWGPCARDNKNCYGHEYFAGEEGSLRRPFENHPDSDYSEQ